MKQKSTAGIGALHPVMFFFLVYGISLFLALFVCRTVYYNLNSNDTNTGDSGTESLNGSAAVAYR